MKDLILPILSEVGKEKLKNLQDNPNLLKQLELILKAIIVQYNEQLAEDFIIEVDESCMFMTIKTPEIEVNEDKVVKKPKKSPNTLDKPE